MVANSHSLAATAPPNAATNAWGERCRAPVASRIMATTIAMTVEPPTSSTQPMSPISPASIRRPPAFPAPSAVSHDDRPRSSPLDACDTSCASAVRHCCSAVHATAWTAEQDVEVVGPPVEAHLDDPGETRPEEYLTEILIPVHER